MDNLKSIKISQKLHKELRIYAAKNSLSLQKITESVLALFLQNEQFFIKEISNIKQFTKTYKKIEKGE